MSFDIYRVLSTVEAQEIVVKLQEMEWGVGLARTKEATGTIKKNKEIKTGHSKEADELIAKIKEAILQHKHLKTDQAIKKMFAPKFNKYEGAGEYQRHGDAAIMGGSIRTDVACTVFLSHPDTYKGGDLCIESADGGYRRLKGDPGTAVVYPCYMPHWVEPVTEGSRICAITWFESCYRDIEQRELMRRFLAALNEMEQLEQKKYGKLYTSFGTIHSKLQRMWVEYQ